MRKVFTYCGKYYSIFCLFIITGFITVKTEAGTGKETAAVPSHSKRISQPGKARRGNSTQPVTGFAHENDTSARNRNSGTSGAVYPVIYTNLMVPQGNTLQLADGVAAAFGNGFSAAVDGDDAIKLWNFDENIALYRDTKYLAIEFRPVPVLTDTLFYRLYLRQQPYTLEIFSQNFTPDMPSHAWLVDRYLNTETAVNLKDTALYNFTPNPDTLSYRNRFMLVLNRQFTANPLPVTKVINQSDPNISGITNSISSAANGVSVYPNPAGTTGKTMLRFTGMQKGSYMAIIYNAKGQKLAELAIQHGGGNAVYALPVNSSWAAGLYTINIINKDSEKAMNVKLFISK